MAYLQNNQTVSVSSTNNVALQIINTSEYDTSQTQNNTQLSLDKISNYISALRQNVSVVTFNRLTDVPLGTKLIPTVALQDTYSCWNILTGEFRSPISSMLFLSGLLILTADDPAILTVYQNGTQIATIFTGTATSYSLSFSLSILGSLGDYVWIKTSAVCTLGATSQLTVRW